MRLLEVAISLLEVAISLLEVALSLRASCASCSEERDLACCTW